MVGGNITDTKLQGVDHFGDAGWWKGSWLDKKANRDAVAVYFNAVLYTKNCGCGAKVAAELERIQKLASSYLPKGE